MQLTREELQSALKVLLPVLEKEAHDARQAVSTQFVAGTTTLDQVAEFVGVARGMEEAALALREFVDTRP